MNERIYGVWQLSIGFQPCGLDVTFLKYPSERGKILSCVHLVHWDWCVSPWSIMIRQLSELQVTTLTRPWFHCDFFGWHMRIITIFVKYTTRHWPNTLDLVLFCVLWGLILCTNIKYSNYNIFMNKKCLWKFWNPNGGCLQIYINL